MKKINFAVLFLLLAAVCLFYKYPKKLSNDVITISMMSGWPPFMFVDSAGNFAGFDVDVAEEVAKRMNKKLMIQDLGSLAACFIALEKNRIDIIMSGLDITQERLNKITMISYTGQNVNEFKLLFWRKIPTGVTTIQDLERFNKPLVIVEPGNSTEKYLDTLSFITKKQISAITDQVLDLSYGKSLAIFLEPQVAQMLVAKNKNLKMLNVPLPQEFQIFGLGIAIKKNNIDMAYDVQTIIDSMKRDGTIKSLEKKWNLEGKTDES